jgi:Holliday junction resolvasome RuvABC DNA-binding subunit
VECLEALLGLGFSSRDEARWMRSIAETFISMGEQNAAAKAFREALKRDPALPNTVRLRRKLHV